MYLPEKFRLSISAPAFLRMGISFGFLLRAATVIKVSESPSYIWMICFSAPENHVITIPQT